MDDVAISSWNLSSFELGLIRDGIGTITDADIDSKYAEWDPVSGDAVTMGFLLEQARDNLPVIDVPEPGTATLLGTAIVMLAGLKRKAS